MKVKVTIGQRSGKRLALQKAGLLPQDATLGSAKPTTEWVHQEEDGDPKLILRCKSCGAKADCFVHGTGDWWPAYEPRYCPVCGKRSVPIGDYRWIVIEAPKDDKLTVRCSDCGGFYVAHDYLMPPKECPHCGTMKAGIRLSEDFFKKEVPLDEVD